MRLDEMGVDGFRFDLAPALAFAMLKAIVLLRLKSVSPVVTSVAG